ncbi:hypothetical protein [uncultured Hyphomicrobium sp.]|uniref:hypothetical protein n=1 Tax=uncultured Hyphomicrobium sp. TaxID=194373 RepID=UPI0025E2CF57|nr:hypothetical protein [uncultured Hyphomicrobium sp.]
MTDFCIQIHPDRNRDLDFDRVRKVCEGLAADKALIKWFAFSDRPADGRERRHINLLFDTDRPADLWRALLVKLYQCETVGRPLQMSSMAMCEGDGGWSDYLLLHHYDPRERLHRL